MKAAHTTVVVTVPGPRRRHPGDQGGPARGRRRARRQQGRSRGRRPHRARPPAHARSARRATARTSRSCARSRRRGTAEGSGIAELAAAIEAHRARAWQGPAGRARAINAPRPSSPSWCARCSPIARTRAIAARGGLHEIAQAVVANAASIRGRSPRSSSRRVVGTARVARHGADARVSGCRREAGARLGAPLQFEVLL